MKKRLPDWAELVSDFVEVFGPGVSVNNVRLKSVPGFQLGQSFAEYVESAGGYIEPYNSAGVGMALFNTTKTT